MSPRLTAALRQTFASAHGSRNFRLYLSGQIVSAVGTWMNFTASSWLVLRLSGGSGTALGLNAALMFGPMLLLGPFGGVLADRRDKRMILAWTQSAFACVALVMGVLVASGNIELWMVYTLSVVAGIVTSIDNPSRQSFYVEMVGEGTLTNAVSLNSAAFMMSRVIGPALAGLADPDDGHRGLLLRRCPVLHGRALGPPGDASRRAPRAAPQHAGARAPAGRAPLRLGDRRAPSSARAHGRGLHLLVPMAGAGAVAGRASVPCGAGGVRRPVRRRRRRGARRRPPHRQPQPSPDHAAALAAGARRGRGPRRGRVRAHALDRRDL